MANMRDLFVPEMLHPLFERLCMLDLDGDGQDDCEQCCTTSTKRLEEIKQTKETKQRTPPSPARQVPGQQTDAAAVIVEMPQVLTQRAPAARREFPAAMLEVPPQCSFNGPTDLHRCCSDLRVTDIS